MSTVVFFCRHTLAQINSVKICSTSVASFRDAVQGRRAYVGDLDSRTCSVDCAYLYNLVNETNLVHDFIPIVFSQFYL